MTVRLAKLSAEEWGLPSVVGLCYSARGALAGLRLEIAYAGNRVLGHTGLLPDLPGHDDTLRLTERNTPGYLSNNWAIQCVFLVALIMIHFF